MAQHGSASTPFERFDMGVMPFWAEASADQQQDQRQWQSELLKRGDVTLGSDVYLSRNAVVFPERLRVGDRSYVCAHSYIWGRVELGVDCTLNPFTEVRGEVTIGDGVRIGAHTSILGFNHGMAIDRPIFEQSLEYKGIAIGDDVWIGSHVTVLDGVTIGPHSIVAAGAVVTKDVAPWSVVAGNPARRIRDRRGRVADSLTDCLSTLVDTALTQIPGIVAQSWDERAGSYVDHPGAEPSVRAWCDAVELADLIGDFSALPVGAERCAQVLRDRQDPELGLVPGWAERKPAWSQDGHAPSTYNVLCVGYALDILGTSFEHPITVVEQLAPRPLRALLDRLPWSTNGWQAGAWVDSVGTAMLWNSRLSSQETSLETLFGWLLTRCNPATGLWGVPDPREGWLEPVNGFYRLTRGTFAQYGAPLPHPRRTIDSVLAHAADARYFSVHRGTACNVLDVIHPLWLAGQQSTHRRAEGEQWARHQLERIARSWQPQAGFSFALERGAGWQRQPGLLGTEMWLAIVWYLADYIGMSDLLGYRPRGIHRPEPATTFRSAGL